MLYSFLKAWAPTVIKFCFRVEVFGQENIPQEGSLVLASNHVSLFDPPLIGAFVPRRIHFMAKEELFENFICNYVFRKLGAFPVKRGCADRNAIKNALKILSDGKILAIFPEGTRSKTGEVRKMEAGAMMVAVKSKSTVVPMAIKGPERLSWRTPFPKIKISFGQPIIINPEDDCKERMQELTEKLKASINEQLAKL